MLPNLLNSKLKKTVLSILFSAPKRSFSINELRYNSGGNLRQLTEVLRDLARAEVVEVAAKKGKKYYRINSYFPLYTELRDLSADEKVKFDDRVARALRALVPAGVRLAVLSGVFTFAPQLDIDVLLVGDDVSRAKLTRALSEIEDALGQDINYTLFSKAEYDYRRFMSDRFLRDVMDNPHIVVINAIKNK